MSHPPFTEDVGNYIACWQILAFRSSVIGNRSLFVGSSGTFRSLLLYFCLPPPPPNSKVFRHVTDGKVLGHDKVPWI